MQHRIILTLCLLLTTTAWAEETARTWRSVSGKVLIENAYWDGNNNSDPNMVFLRKGEKRYKIAFDKLSKEDQMYVTSSKDHTTDIAQAPRLTPVIQTGHDNSVDSILFTPDSRFLLAEGGNVILWDLETGYQVYEYDDSCSISGFTPEGKVFGVSKHDCSEFDYITEQFQKRKLVSTDNDKYTYNIFHDKYGKFGLITKQEDYRNTNEADLIDLISDKVLRTFRIPTGTIEHSFFLPDTDISIFLSCKDLEHYLYAYNFKDGNLLWSEKLSNADKIYQTMASIPGTNNFIFAFKKKDINDSVEFMVKDGSTGSTKKSFSVLIRQNYDVSFAVSPSGKVLAVEDDINTHLVSMSTGKVLSQLIRDIHKIDNLCFSPDEKLLATCGNDNCITIWDIESGKIDNILGKGVLYRNQPDSVDCTSDGQTYITIDDNKKVTVFRGCDGAKIQVYYLNSQTDKTHKIEGDRNAQDLESKIQYLESSFHFLSLSNPSKIRISDNGQYYVVCTMAEISVHKTDTGEIVERLGVPQNINYPGVLAALSPDGHYLAYTYSDSDSYYDEEHRLVQRLFLYDLEQKTRVWEKSDDRPLPIGIDYGGVLSFSKDGSKIWGNMGPAFCCWDSKTGESRKLIDNNTNCKSLNIPAVISPNKRYIAYSKINSQEQYTGEVVIYNTQDMNVISTINIHIPKRGNNKCFMCFSGDEKSIWIEEGIPEEMDSEYNYKVCKYDILTGNLQIKKELEYEVSVMNATQNDRLFLSSIRFNLFVLDSKTLLPLYQLEEEQKMVPRDLQFNKKLGELTCYAKNWFITINPTTGAPTRTYFFKDNSLDINAYTVSPDCEHLLTISYDNHALIWNTANPIPVKGFCIPKKEGVYYLDEVALSNDGNLILVSRKYLNKKDVREGEDNAIYYLNIYDIEKDKILKTVELPILPKHDSLQTAFRWNSDFSVSYICYVWEKDASEAKVFEYTLNLKNYQVQIKQKTEGLYPVHLKTTFSGKEEYSQWTDCALDILNNNLTMTSSGLVDIKTNKIVLQYILLNNCRDWLAITPEGLFDGTPEARRLVTYRVGETFSVQPVEAFFQDFYYPGLFGAIWKGERPMPNVKVKEQIPPEIVIVSPKSSESSEGKVRFEVVVKNMGGGIQKPSITINGIGVGVKEKPIVTEKEVRWSFDLPLTNGENKVVIRSATADGQIASQSQPVTIQYLPKLENPPRLFVLTVGVSDYTAGAKNDLQCAAADATALAKAFESNGKRFYGKDGVFVKTLTEKDVTKEKIQQAIQEIAQNTNPEDIFVFSLAGHGSTVGQLYYYYPVNFPFEDDYQPVDSVIRENGIGGDLLNDWINSVPAMKRIVIYDTCQSEAALKRNAMEERKAMEMLSRMTGCYTIAAAAGKEAALELPDVGHGVLTYALLGGLGVAEKGLLKDRSAASEDGLIRVRDWLGFAQDNVSKLSELSFGTEQRAIFQSGANNFPLLKK